MKLDSISKEDSKDIIFNVKVRMKTKIIPYPQNLIQFIQQSDDK